ncbi:MAG: hypothetical protein A4E62_01797 [Syntrophorhabdus sp. PtaU1.Bin002]|nr:MAG: hypothetical protein A4E58_02369 [Syntrophorhabdus sp. PtaB.Bin006]OPY69498.1 MAG: hypothetical protein A4E62_01797 [Syntrophorhabdus sp. PtaU1.Bin002]
METNVANPALCWTVWGIIILGTFTMTLLGTWLIARRWEE